MELVKEEMDVLRMVRSRDRAAAPCLRGRFQSRRAVPPGARVARIAHSVKHCPRAGWSNQFQWQRAETTRVGGGSRSTHPVQ